MDSSNFTDMKINCIEFTMNMRQEPPTSAYNIYILPCTSLLYLIHLTLIETLPSTTYECGLVVFIKVQTALTAYGRPGYEIIS